MAEQAEKDERAPFGINVTRRYVSPGAEELLYRPQRISGHPSGYVELVDYMGGDSTIERAATATRSREILIEKVEQEGLFAYLTTNKIMRPFRFAQVKLSFQAPISDALQFVYVPEANVNEYSGRYSEMLDTALIPKEEDVAAMMRATGKGDSNAGKIAQILSTMREENFSKYRQMLAVDFARELARSGLGSDNDTRFYLKVPFDVAATLVRSGPSDAPHTRLYRNALAAICEKVAPVAWQVLMANNYGRSSIREDRPKVITLYPPQDEAIVDPGLSKAFWGPSETRRVVVPALEEKLFVPIPILNHGAVQATDYMGDDTSLAQAARTSYGVSTKTLQEDKGLIRSLVRDRHNTPLEMAELAFEVKGPVLIFPRQLGRHRTVDSTGFLGAVPIGSQFYIAEDGDMQYQDRKNRQGRSLPLTEEHRILCKDILNDVSRSTLEGVAQLRELGAPEALVRPRKGVAFYTIGSMTSDVHNWGGFLSLRADPHAQKEAQEVAFAIKGVLEAHCPIAVGAMRDYRFGALTLSAHEIEAIKVYDLFNTSIQLHPELFRGTPFAIPVNKNIPEGELKFSREGEGFISKLDRLVPRNDPAQS